MNLDDQLRVVLNEEAAMRTPAPPDVQDLISAGRTRRRRRNAVWAGGGVLAAVLAAGGLYGIAQIGDDEADSPGLIATTPTPGALPTSDEPVEIGAGTYLVRAGNGEVAPYTVTVPAGWAAQHGDILAKHPDEPGAIMIDSFVLDTTRLTDDACTGPETLGKAQTSTAGLVAGLRAQGSGPRVGDPVAATVGGLPATRIDLDFPSAPPRTSCRLARGGLQIWRGAPSDYFVLFPAESASVYVVDVGGRSQLFVTQTRDDASAADRAELESILGSIRIGR